MKIEQCPICYSTLEVRLCSPCEDCGYLENNSISLTAEKYQYNIYEVYPGLRIQLCSFCDVDFGSYKPEYLGFDDGRRIGYDKLIFISKLENLSIEKDKYCRSCDKRLKFLKFLKNLRELTLQNKI
jgi:hypothetical protein